MFVVVDFVGSLAAKAVVRTRLVVPIDEELQLAAELVAMQRHNNSSRAAFFQRADETLDYRDATVLAHGAGRKR